MKHLPNFFTVLRLLMFPLYALLFARGAYIAALAVFFAAGVTDVLDGALARRLRRITAVGKLLDPLADKLMQLTVLVCYFTVRWVPLWFLLLHIIKELAQAVLGLLMLRLRRVAVVSHWYGKCTVVVLYVTLIFAMLVVICGASAPWLAARSILWVLSAVCLVATFAGYVSDYARQARRLAKHSQNSDKG